MRSYEESCALLDRIVGRCVRDEGFADRVLDDPATALASYGLHQHELDDFLALKAGHREQAASGWAEIRDALASLSAHS